MAASSDKPGSTAAKNPESDQISPLGQAIRYFRQEQRMTQEALAEATSEDEKQRVDKQRISDIERGATRTLHPATIMKLCDGLGITLDDLKAKEREFAKAIKAEDARKLVSRRDKGQFSIIHNEIRPVPGFTGREDLLASIDAALWQQGGTAALTNSGAHAAAVKGLGGVGKSVLAREYAWRARGRYRGVWWVRANIVHIAPSRDMLTDALAQFLVLKKWPRWFLISGSNQPDKAYADALRRSAKKFGAQIVEEKAYAVTDASARTDSGHAQVQQQMAIFTQISTNYDVLVVADESEIFGPYLPFRTWSPRPVAGTSGLSPMSWHPAHEQWGATQMQNRFQKLTGRLMTPMDFHGWLAARAIGEAATRTKSVAFQPLRDYLLNGEFGVAAFKGQKVSIRKWNQQVRQPIAVAITELPVSWSPQPGFLHQRAEVDTLGGDEPETRCKLQ